MPSDNQDAFDRGEHPASEESLLLEPSEQPRDDDIRRVKPDVAQPSRLLLVIVPALVMRSGISSIAEADTVPLRADFA